MQSFLLGLHLIIVVLLIGVILIQRSEGGGLGMGQEGNFMKSRSKGTALTRMTAYLSVAFFTSTIAITIAFNPVLDTGGDLDQIEIEGFKDQINELGLPELGDDLTLPDLNEGIALPEPEANAEPAENAQPAKPSE